MQPSSDRWYCETQPLRLAYIPIILGSYSPSAFSIPFHRFFDSVVSILEKVMLPCEIEPEVKERLFIKIDALTWLTAIQKVQEIKHCIKRFLQIIKNDPSENCTEVFELFCKNTEGKFQNLWDEFIVCVRFLDVIDSDVDKKILK